MFLKYVGSVTVGAPREVGQGTSMVRHKCPVLCRSLFSKTRSFYVAQVGLGLSEILLPLTGVAITGMATTQEKKMFPVVDSLI